MWWHIDGRLVLKSRFHPDSSLQHRVRTTNGYNTYLWSWVKIKIKEVSFAEQQRTREDIHKMLVWLASFFLFFGPIIWASAVVCVRISNQAQEICYILSLAAGTYTSIFILGVWHIISSFIYLQLLFLSHIILLTFRDNLWVYVISGLVLTSASCQPGLNYISGTFQICFFKYLFEEPSGSWSSGEC